jgi:hypothetical protein
MERKREEEPAIHKDKVLKYLKKTVGVRNFCGNEDTCFEQWVSETNEGKFGDKEICTGLSRVLPSQKKILFSPKSRK